MSEENNYSKKEVDILNKYNIERLKKLDTALKKLQNHSCRGEISIIDVSDTSNKPIVQTHYEYFIMRMTPELLLIERNNGVNSMGSLEYTMVDNSKITDYKVNKTSIIINGELDGNYRIQIMAVFKNPLESLS